MADRESAVSETNGLRFEGEAIQKQKSEFDKDVKDCIMRRRLFAWNIHFIILNFAIILIYPSQHLEIFEKLADDGSDVKMILKTLEYYMFISGVFHQKVTDKTMYVSYW